MLSALLAATLSLFRTRAALTGHLESQNPVCSVDLGRIPNGLNALELEQYLRESGAKLRRSARGTVSDNAEDFNLGGRGHKSLVKESGVSIRGR